VKSETTMRGAGDTSVTESGFVDIETLPTQKDLSEIAYASIQRYVIEGQLPQGARLTESEVAKKLGISTTPVRAAFRRLELEGLVRVVPRRFVEVVKFTEQDVNEIIDLRESLECLAVRLAVGRCSQSDIDNLKASLAGAEQERAKRRIPAFTQSDNNFHVSLVRMSGNSRLNQAYLPLSAQIQAILVRTRDELNWPGQTTEEHAAIVEAIQRRDAAVAEAILRDHIRRVKERYIKYNAGKVTNDEVSA
jgi:DNA-binding GntR family transcriptional regulator